MPKAKLAHLWERDPLDWYVEPERVTAELAAVLELEGHTHDPCCGGGNVVRALLAAGHSATGSDLVARAGDAPWFLGCTDFLNPDGLGLYGADNCVFNPPFFRAVGAERCIRRALELAPRKVAAFVEARFLFSGGRARGLYRDHPPARVWIIANRPSCPPGAFLAAGGEAKGGTPDFAWIVWDRAHRGASEIGWLA